MKIDVRSDMGNMAIKLEKVGKQLRFVVSRALNLTAAHVKREAETQIQRKLSAPKSYTARSLFMKAASKANLEAQVAVKNVKLGGAKYTQEQTLGHLFVQAPTRNHNPLERWLIAKHFITDKEYLMPTRAVTLDAYGNMPRSLVRQIVAGLSQRAPATGKRRRGGVVFWADGSGLTRGLWRRVGDGIEMIGVVTAEPSYRVRVNLPALAQGVVRSRFEGYLDAAIDDAIRTAR